MMGGRPDAVNEKNIFVRNKNNVMVHYHDDLIHGVIKANSSGYFIILATLKASHSGKEGG